MKTLGKRLPMLLAAAGSVIYISLIFNNNLWMDEAFSAVLVRGTFSEMMKRSLADTLPPLYNILAWTLTHILGFNTCVLKLTSVLPMIALLFFSAVKLTRLYNCPTASFFVLSMTAMPHFLQYGTEIRMYSLCVSFTAMAAIYALQFRKDSSLRSGIMFSAFSALSAYSHHYGILSLAFVWIFLLIYIVLKNRPALKAWFLSAGLTVLLCIPYVIITVFQIENSTSYFSSGSDPSDGFFAAFRYPYVTNITMLSAILLFSVVFICIAGSRLAEGYALISVYILVLLLSYALMLITGKVFFSGRYLMPAISLLWLGYSILLSDIRLELLKKHTKALTVIYVILLLSVLAASYIQQFREEYKPGVSEMLAFFDENLTPDDGYIIFEDNYEIEWCMRYYEPDLTRYSPEDIGKIKGNIWYFSVPGHENMLDESILEEYNIVYKDAMSFDRYSFDLYQLTSRE